MTLRIVRTGHEPILREAVDWLEAKGIPAKCIRSVSMDAEVGQVMSITATFYVDEPDNMADPEQLRDQAADLIRQAATLEGYDPDA